ncbi:hypothetical protein BC940DRAFT_293672 [Gongronella butleri]|nr:hypothetical protein BC940DRAFT_293672 [Gongronella butleri]
MKLDNVRHFISQATSSRFVALASESMLLLMGPALIVMNLVYFRQWTNSVFMVDADIYYALTALVTVLTMVLLVFTCRRSVRKIKYILCCTVFAVVVLLVVGVVHGSLILSLYRFSLLVRCFQRNTQSSWSIFGYAHQQSVDECQQTWKEYGVFSLLSCIAYVFGAV